MEKRLKLNIDIIKIYLLIQVLADLTTTFLVKNYSINFSVATFIRGGFLMFAIASTAIDGDKKDRILLFTLISYIIAHTIISSTAYHYAITYKVMSIMKAFTFPFIILYFYSLFKRIRKAKQQASSVAILLKATQISALTYASIITLMYLMGTGFKSYPGVTDLRIGSIGYFLAANELGPFLLLVSFLSLFQFYRSQTIVGVISVITSFFALMIIGTKTALIGAIALAFLLAITILTKSGSLKKGFIGAALVTLCFSVSFFQLPSFRNLALHKNQMSERRYYEHLKKGDPVREVDQQRHDASEPNNTHEFLERLILTADGDSLEVSGYLYPKYEDIGHPNFVDTRLRFMDGDTVIQEFLLENKYNPNISHDLEDTYNSAFSSFYANLDSNKLTFNQAMTLEISMTVDGLRSYQRIIPFDFAATPTSDFTLISSANMFKFIHQTPSETADEEGDLSSFDELIALLLSGRSTRLNNFMKQHGSFSSREIIFGTGQLVGSIQGFEMDPFEIFIVYGGAGTLVYFGLFIALLFTTGFNAIKRYGAKVFISLDVYILLIPLALAIIIGTLSGHTFITPRVSISLALSAIVAWLVYKGDNHE